MCVCVVTIYRIISIVFILAGIFLHFLGYFCVVFRSCYIDVWSMVDAEPGDGGGSLVRVATTGWTVAVKRVIQRQRKQSPKQDDQDFKRECLKNR